MYTGFLKKVLNKGVDGLAIDSYFFALIMSKFHKKFLTWSSLQVLDFDSEVMKNNSMR